MSKPFRGMFPREISPVVSVATSRDGKHVAVARLNYAVELWTVGGELLKWHRVHKKQIETVVLSDDGRSVASLTKQPRLKRAYRELVLWGVDSSRITIVPPTSMSTPVFAPDRKILVVDQGVPVFYDLSTGREAASQIDHDGQDSGISDAFAFSPTGELLASTTRSGQIRLWNMSSLQAVRTLEGHCDQVDLIAFSSDGTLIASAGLDDTLRIWNVTTGEIVRHIDVSCEEPFHFTYLDEWNGWLLVDRKHGLRVFGIDGEDDHSALLPDSDTVNAVASSSQGSVLIIGREDGIVYVWRTDDLLQGVGTEGKVSNSSEVSELQAIMQLIQPLQRDLRLTKVKLVRTPLQKWLQHVKKYPNDTVDAFVAKKWKRATEEDIQSLHAQIEQVGALKGLSEMLKQLEQSISM